jgi:hypothetical protein
VYAPLLSPTRATSPAHLIPLDLIAQTIFGDECKQNTDSINKQLTLQSNKFVTKQRNQFRKAQPYVNHYVRNFVKLYNYYLWLPNT